MKDYNHNTQYGKGIFPNPRPYVLLALSNTNPIVEKVSRVPLVS